MLKLENDTDINFEKNNLKKVLKNSEFRPKGA